MNKPKLSVSVGCFGLEWLNGGGYRIIRKEEFFKETLVNMKKLGFDAIEFGTAGPWNYEEERENFPWVKTATKMIRDSGLDFNSAHLPFSLSWYNISSLDEKERLNSVEHFKWVIDQFDGDLPRLFVVHPDPPPEPGDDRNAKLEQLTKSLTSICDFSPVPICVENMVNDGLLNVSSEALKVLNAVPKLYMTVDLNHALYENVANYIRKVGSRVKNVHVSDRDEITERHWLPKTGILDFDDIMNALKEINYSGALSYEVGIGEKYSLEQVKQNYDEITSVFDKNN